MQEHINSGVADMAHSQPEVEHIHTELNVRIPFKLQQPGELSTWMSKQTQYNFTQLSSAFFFRLAQQSRVTPNETSLEIFFNSKVDCCLHPKTNETDSHIKRFLFRTSFATFQRVFSRVIIEAYLQGRASFTLKHANLPLLKKTETQDLPYYLANVEVENLRIYTSHLKSDTVQHFLKKQFKVFRHQWFMSQIKGVPRSLVGVGLGLAFYLAYYVSQKNTQLSLFDALSGWVQFLKNF